MGDCRKGTYEFTWPDTLKNLVFFRNSFELNFPVCPQIFDNAFAEILKISPSAKKSTCIFGKIFDSFHEKNFYNALQELSGKYFVKEILGKLAHVVLLYHLSLAF